MNTVAWILLYWMAFIAYGVQGVIHLTMGIGCWIGIQVLALVWFYNKWFSR